MALLKNVDDYLFQDGRGGAEDNGERCVEQSSRFKWAEIDGCARVRIGTSVNIKFENMNH